MNIGKKRGGFLDNSKGQVTIFIIIAILIIGVILLIYFLRPTTEVSTEFSEENPSRFLQTCLEDDIESSVETLSVQGGSIEPEHYILYQDERIEYLCYQEEYYQTCVIQRPLLKEHIEAEIKEDIGEEVSNCFNQLEENYRERNYNVELERGITRVELLPKRIIIHFDNYVLTVSRADTDRYDSFDIILNNNLYELVSIANSIIDWEATYGDAEASVYMTYYQDLKVEKKVKQDGTTIYILTDRNTGNKFQFASRSVAWPPGYGTEGVSSS